MSETPSYDYIIAGAGAAGLSLAVHMVQNGLSHKKILLVDKERKNRNDRTWCFWETGPGLFEPVVYRRWDKVAFHGQQIDAVLPLGPYQYKMIRGIDFYRYCLDLLQQYPAVSFVTGNIDKISNEGAAAAVWVEGKKITASYVFNSLMPLKEKMQPNATHLLQHFKGWTIQLPQPFFNAQQATLMDFRVSQQHGTTFCYVMPLSATTALVEYTLFSKELLAAPQYDEGLKEYLHQVLGIRDYTITEEEFGIIPMTTHRFAAGEGRIINIGTAGGQTKASSGYTFRFIQKHAAAIVQALQQDRSPLAVGQTKKRFHFYDHTLLHILYHNTLPGKTIFSRLFRKNRAPQVFKFLDNETSVGEELKIISTLPAIVFLQAAWKQF